MINSRALDDLLPQVKNRMVNFLARTELVLEEAFPGTKFKVWPTCTLRDGEYQAKIYAQGRTEPGAIVTNAKPGQSMHEYKCAMDFAIEMNGKITWERKYYDVAGQIAIDEGLTWGGDWNANGVMDKADWDCCHVQWTGGLSLQQLAQGMEVPVA
jgi:peptidoglycan L-alanyl-D-glutamate endopeptidase CwlK